MTGLPTGKDGEAIFFAAIIEARTGFLRRLGIDRVAEIVAYSSTETPTTNNEAVRLIAEVAEIKWVRMVLMRTTTTVTLDGAGGSYSDYHHEAPFRETGPFERNIELKKLQEEINEAIDVLSEDEIIPNEVTGARLALIEPDTTPPLPGSSIFNWWPQA